MLGDNIQFNVIVLLSFLFLKKISIKGITTEQSNGIQSTIQKITSSGISVVICCDAFPSSAHMQICRLATSSKLHFIDMTLTQLTRVDQNELDEQAKIAGTTFLPRMNRISLCTQYLLHRYNADAVVVAFCGFLCNFTHLLNMEFEMDTLSYFPRPNMTVLRENGSKVVCCQIASCFTNTPGKSQFKVRTLKYIYIFF